MHWFKENGEYQEPRHCIDIELMSVDSWLSRIYQASMEFSLSVIGKMMSRHKEVFFQFFQFFFYFFSEFSFVM